MPTALDAPDHMLDRQERNFVDQVRQHGWFDTNVFGEDESPGFSYTTGFWLRAKAPEIIVFSLRPEIAHDSLWHLYRAITAGTSFPIGLRRSGVFENVDAVSYQLPENSIAITLAGAAGSMAATTGLVCKWCTRTQMACSRGTLAVTSASHAASRTLPVRLGQPMCRLGNKAARCGSCHFALGSELLHWLRINVEHPHGVGSVLPGSKLLHRRRIEIEDPRGVQPKNIPLGLLRDERQVGDLARHVEVEVRPVRREQKLRVRLDHVEGALQRLEVVRLHRLRRDAGTGIP
jgi:hypothetical protein